MHMDVHEGTGHEMAFADQINILLILTVVIGCLIAVGIARYVHSRSKSQAQVITRDGRSKKEQRIAKRPAKSGFLQGDVKPKPVKEQSSTPEANLNEIMGENRQYPGQGNLHGYNFQTKILCLYFCLGHGFQNFRMATEVPETVVGKFDDLVLCYDEEDEDKSKTKYYFLQAKEIIKDDFPNVTPQDLKSTTDKRFSLPMYFNSYVDLRTQFLKLNDGKCSKLHCIEHLIIYTNAKFDLLKFDVLEEAVDLCKAAKDKIVIRKFKTESPFIPGNSYQFVQFPSEELRQFYEKTDNQRHAIFQEFLEKLVFAVGQPDFSKLDGAIIQALSNVFNLDSAVSMSNEIVGQVWNIYAKPVLRVIKNDEILDFFEVSQKQINERFLLGVRFTNHLQSIDFSSFFKTDEDIAKFLHDHGLPCISINSESVTLTSIKLAQVLRCNRAKFNFPEQYFAVIDLQLLLNNKERVKLTLECRKEFSMVVKWGSCEATPQDVENVVSELLHFGSQKKIILVGSEKCDFSRMFANTHFTNYLDKCDFEDLTDESKAMLMNRFANFQGREVKLSDIISESGVQSLKTNMALLDKIIEEEKLRIGEPASSLSAFGDFYIQRQFVWNLKYDVDCLSTIPDSEILVLTNVSNSKMEIVNKYLNGDDFGKVLVIEQPISDEYFANICRRFSSKNVHWLDGVGNAAQVIKSEQRHYLSLDQLIMSGEKVVIITGEPGIGKSYSLAHLLKQMIITKLGVLWLIKVNLVSWVDQLEVLSEKTCLDLSHVVDLLCKVENMDQEYEKELLTYHLVNADNSYICFDGFDEICPSYEDVVIKILKILKRTRANIWITTRPHFQYKLEKEMSCFSYKLVPFSESEQKTFLFEYWTKVVSNFDEQHVLSFVDKVFEILLNFRIKSISHLIGIPLQAKMVAELYQDDCTRFLRKPEEGIVIEQVSDILELYERFVERKYDIYFKEKALLNHNTPNVLKIKKECKIRFPKEHSYFALKLLYPKDIETFVASEVVRTVSVDDVSELLTVGLILKETDNCIFTHRTFAEYFAAKHLADIVQKGVTSESNRYSKVLEFLEENYLKESSAMMGIFFDNILAKGSDILQAAVNDDLLKMASVLKTNPQCLSDCDSLNRNALHLVGAYSGYQKISVGENISTAIALLFRYQSWLQIDKCDKLNFNVFCFALGKNESTTLIFDEVRRNVEKECLVNMVSVLLRVLYQCKYKVKLVNQADRFAYGMDVKYLMSYKLSVFVEHQSCLTFVQDNMHHQKRMKAFLRVFSEEKTLRIFTENDFKFLKHTLTHDSYFSDLLLSKGVNLSCLKERQESLVRLNEFQAWFFNVVTTFQFTVLNKLLITGIVSETGGKVLWQLPSLNVLQLFRSAVSKLENKLVCHVLLSLSEQVADLFASIDYVTYFRTVFLNKMYYDFMRLFDTCPSDDVKARILNDIDHVALFEVAMGEKDYDTLANLIDYFNSESEIQAMKAGVSNQLVIEYSKWCISRCMEEPLDPLLRCISKTELTRVWDVLGCEGDIDNFGYRRPGYSVVKMLTKIPSYPDCQELAVFLDNYPLENPPGFEWSVWEHVYSLFFSIEMSLTLPPDIVQVFGENYIQHLLDNKTNFQNVAYVFHLATIDQKRAICRAEEHSFFKHAVCNYFTVIINEKCGNGKYLEGMQDEIVVLQEYGICFNNAVDSRDFKVLLTLTKYLSIDMQVSMWMATHYLSVFLAAIERSENEFAFHLNEVLSTALEQDLLKSVDFTKTFVKISTDDLGCFNDLFRRLTNDQKRDVIAQTTMLEEVKTAVAEMDFSKLNSMFGVIEGHHYVRCYIKEQLNVDDCIVYFKHHIANHCGEGIRALLQYVTGEEIINIRHYSLYCFQVLQKECMQILFGFIDDKYLQQILDSLDDYNSARRLGYHLSVFQHVLVLIGCRWHRERIPDYFLKYFKIDNPYLDN